MHGCKWRGKCTWITNLVWKFWQQTTIYEQPKIHDHIFSWPHKNNRAVSHLFLFPLSCTHMLTQTHTYTKGALWTRDKEIKIMPNKERSSRWPKWPRKSLPHYIKIIIIIIKNLFWSTQSSLNVVYDWVKYAWASGLSNFFSLRCVKPLVNNKTINNKTFVSVIYANPIFI